MRHVKLLDGQGVARMSYREFVDRIEVDIGRTTRIVQGWADVPDLKRSIRQNDERLYEAFSQAERRFEVAQATATVQQKEEPRPLLPMPEHEAFGLLLAAAAHSGHGLWGISAVLRSAGDALASMLPE